MPLRRGSASARRERPSASHPVGAARVRPPTGGAQVEARLASLEAALAQEQQSSLKALQAILEHSQAAAE